MRLRAERCRDAWESQIAWLLFFTVCEIFEFSLLLFFT